MVKKMIGIHLILIIYLTVFVSAEVCTDSDGIDFYKKGVAYGEHSDANGTRIDLWEDYCIGNFVYDFTCETNVNPGASEINVWAEIEDCPNGCSDGACVGKILNYSTKVTCTDSDGGVDYFNKGITLPSLEFEIHEDVCALYPEGQFEPEYVDSCLGDDCVVIELFCNPYYTLSDIFNCPNGCENGACMSIDDVLDYPTSITCTDSDGGENVFKKGMVEPSLLEINEDVCALYLEGQFEPEYVDSCLGDDCILIELFCGLGNTANFGFYSGCENGCENGACIGTCTDSDGGENPYEKGRTTPSLLEINEDVCALYLEDQFEPEHVDSCLGDDCILIELICDSNKADFEYVECEDGCENGACIRKANFESCFDCELGGKCYPLSYRKDGKFCSENDVFINYSLNGEVCENNFECDSNVCVSGECISAGLIEKVLNWFRRVFGDQ
ncbi:MAG: hypothetical protein IH845_01290 [Nanoarchaeota archaeon]|nr:hypothetical protein [Nanoarchaeota archaeon]